MNIEDIRTAIAEFLDLIEHGTESLPESEAGLDLLLDHLALARHYCEGDADDDAKDAPTADQDALRDKISGQFPRFGLYNTPDVVTDDIAEASCIVGDAIEDIVEITADLHEVAWHLDNGQEAHGLWLYAWGFDAHWGSHLRQLQVYLLELGPPPVDAPE